MLDQELIQDAMAELEVDGDLAAGLLSGFIRDEVSKVGVKKLVLGLSGGIDSALSAFLAAAAMGPENVTGVIMPYRLSNPQSEADARAVAGASGINFKVVDISPRWMRISSSSPMPTTFAGATRWPASG